MATQTIGSSDLNAHTLDSQAAAISTDERAETDVESKTYHYNNWPNDDGFETDKEQRTPIELNVTGHIPAYVAGILYRTGPGNYKVDTEDGKTLAASHWFDGFTQVHRFEIRAPSDSCPKTRVFYNSRRSVDSMIENIRKTGNMGAFTFGQKRDPCQSFFKKVMGTFAPFKLPDSGKPDVRNFGVTLSVDMPGLPQLPSSPNHSSLTTPTVKTLVNKSDSNGYQYLDPTTLEPIGLASQTALHPSLAGPLSATHAKTDPLTGDVYNFNLEVSKTSTYRIFCVSASTSQTTILATITSAPSAYVHSFFLTPRHVILCVWGSHFAYRGLSLIYHRNILDSLAPLDPSKPCLWYVIDRSPTSKGLLATYTSLPFFAFHTINAYEAPSVSNTSGVDILADLCCYSDLSILKRFYYTNLKSSSPSSLDFVGEKGTSTHPWLGRFRLPNVPIPASTSSINSPEDLQEAIQEFAIPPDQSLELPSINPSRLTLPYRYVYGVTDRGSSTFFDGLAKFDTHTQTSIFWSEKGQSAGEPIFVADPDNGTGDLSEEEEDRGVLLTVVLDGYRSKSYLLVLDAKTMSPIGRADVDGIVGFGFHGLHVPSSGRVVGV